MSSVWICRPLRGYKLYAPKGVGALYIRSGTRLESPIHLAPDTEKSGRRAGTESALLATALGTASTLAADLASMEAARHLRDQLWKGFSRSGFGQRVVLNGHPERRLPNTLNVSFVGHTGSDILCRDEG